MARRSEPWFREERGQWYVWHQGQQIRLGPDKDDAFDQWHNLMALSRVTTAGDNNPFRAVAELFLDYTSRNSKPKTYKVYRLHLQAFEDVHGDVKIRDLRPIHVDDLLKQHPNWNKSTERGVKVCILTTLNWAVKQGITTRNPLSKRLDIPPIVSRGRDSVISEADYEMMLAYAKPRLRDFLIACRNSGTRPHTVASVTAKNFDDAGECWVMKEHKTDDTGEPLIVHLNPTLLALTKKLIAERPEGPLFVNSRDNPWTDTALGKAMDGLRKTLKKTGVKLSCTGILYGFRHTYATDLLEKGVPDAHVASLLGHKSTAMLAKHYSHLTSKAKSLKLHLSHIGILPCEAQPVGVGSRSAGSGHGEGSSASAKSVAAT